MKKMLYPVGQKTACYERESTMTSYKMDFLNSKLTSSYTKKHLASP